MVLMNTVCEPLIIHLSVHIHLMDGLSMAPSSGQAVAGSHGVEAVEESLVAGEGSVVGDNKKNSVCMGAFDGTQPPNPFRGKGRPA
jgi:hypothetical protein